MSDDQPRPFRVDVDVDPGEERQFRFEVSETYLGDPVGMRWGPNPLVHEGEAVRTITDHFEDEAHTVDAPFTGFVVGILENPVALPGHPICHLVRIGSETREEIEQEISRGEFDGYRSDGQRWIADEEDAE
jgi:hypothetical protein